MHEPVGPHDPAAKIVADSLMAQTYAEDGLFACKRADHGERYPGFGRRAGAGGDEYAVGIEGEGLGGGDLVVAEHALLHAQLPEILDKVESERVEVVDNEEHVV